MSYVLDALRRADAERSRGAVPDLHAQPVLLASHAAAARRGARGLRLAGLAAAGLAIAAAFAWWWLLRPSSAVAPAATPAVTATPAPIATAAAPTAPAPRAAASALALPPVPAPLPATALASAPSMASAPSIASAPAAALATPGPASPAAAARLPQLKELPEALRHELPALSFGGAMDSPQPAARMLIVNGQLLHEGEAAAPGLVLQTIRLRSAVFEYKGSRFEVSY